MKLRSSHQFLKQSFPPVTGSWICFQTAYVHACHTCLAGIIHQDDLFEQDSRGRVQDAVDGPEEGGPSLIVEDNNNTGGRQVRTATELPLHTPDHVETHRRTKTKNVK